MPKIDAILVTGAGRGIGRAIAGRLGAAGFRVGCLARSATARDTAAAIVARGGSAEAIVVDLDDLSATEHAVKAWADGAGAARFGAVLAAGALGAGGGLLEADLAEWDRVYRVNVLGNLAALRGVLPAMLASQFGRIVAFAGGGSAYAYPAFSAYSLAKTSMVRAVENLHEELKTRGDFGVVCLAPGAVETDMLQRVRAAGAEVKTTVPIDEPAACVERWMTETAWQFSGRFVHVRDAWADFLGGANHEMIKHQWMLRRIEPERR